MLVFVEGDIFESQAEALVNPVNTVGVMGKGLAAEFRRRFPANTRLYESACEAQAVRTGRMFVTELAARPGPRWLVNFPTKRHWRHPSRLEWITEGLEDLRLIIAQHQVRSIAVPALGAGNGGLDWTLVRDEIERSLGGDRVDAEVSVYQPHVATLDKRRLPS